jgi:hypothetical protein
MSQKEPQHRSSRSLRTDSIHSSGRPPAPADGKPNPLSRTLFAIFGGYKPVPKKTFDEEGAKKVDPKIYFSLERTFLAWMKASVWIAGISIAIGSRSASTDAQALYGLFFLGVAIAFIIYALVQCEFHPNETGLIELLSQILTFSIKLASLFFFLSRQAISDGGATIPGSLRRQKGSYDPGNHLCLVPDNSIFRVYWLLLFQVERN